MRKKITNYQLPIINWEIQQFNSSIVGRSVLLFTLCIAISVFDSCKMGYSFTGASIPPEAKTVAIKYFNNQAPLANPSMSQSLTEAVKDIFVSQTSLSLTDKNADLNFEGSITGYATSPVSIQSNDQAALNRLTITVSVKYTNKFDEKKNFETSFSRFSDYPSNKSLSEVEGELIRTINKQIAEDIFNKALNNW